MMHTVFPVYVNVLAEVLRLGVAARKAGKEAGIDRQRKFGQTGSQAGISHAKTLAKRPGQEAWPRR